MIIGRLGIFEIILAENFKNILQFFLFHPRVFEPPQQNSRRTLGRTDANL
jgi:hypothetical protein